LVGGGHLYIPRSDPLRRTSRPRRRDFRRDLAARRTAEAAGGKAEPPDLLCQAPARGGPARRFDDQNVAPARDRDTRTESPDPVARDQQTVFSNFEFIHGTKSSWYVHPNYTTCYPGSSEARLAWTGIGGNADLHERFPLLIASAAESEPRTKPR